MPRKKLVSKSDEKKILRVLLVVALLFVGLSFIVPMLPVAEVALGVEKTLWQNIHGFFVDSKQFIVDFWMFIMILAGGLFLYFKLRK